MFAVAINLTIERQQLIEIAQMVKDLVSHEYLYFSEPLKVKLTPHSPEINLWGICVSPANDVFVCELKAVGAKLQDGRWHERPEEEWHQIEACDQNANIIIPSIYQRIKLIKQQYEAKSNNR